ncbi:MAG: hypothetical protein WCE68_05495 [Anaerolineales bacterium]
MVPPFFSALIIAHFQRITQVFLQNLPAARERAANAGIPASTNAGKTAYNSPQLHSDIFSMEKGDSHDQRAITSLR